MLILGSQLQFPAVTIAYKLNRSNGIYGYLHRKESYIMVKNICNKSTFRKCRSVGYTYVHMYVLTCVNTKAVPWQLFHLQNYVPVDTSVRVYKCCCHTSQYMTVQTGCRISTAHLLVTSWVYAEDMNILLFFSVLGTVTVKSNNYHINRFLM